VFLAKITGESRRYKLSDYIKQQTTDAGWIYILGLPIAFN